jgi:hypothetical protein
MYWTCAIKPLNHSLQSGKQVYGFPNIISLRTKSLWNEENKPMTIRK